MVPHHDRFARRRPSTASRGHRRVLEGYLKATRTLYAVKSFKIRVLKGFEVYSYSLILERFVFDVVQVFEVPSSGNTWKSVGPVEEAVAAVENLQIRDLKGDLDESHVRDSFRWVVTRWVPPYKAHIRLV